MGEKNINKENPSDALVESFDLIVRSFRIAIKNSVFYETDHPICAASLKSFHEALEGWFTIKNSIRIEISPDNLFLESKPVKKDSFLYSEVADYLHQRGLLTLTFYKGISFDEVTEFFNSIRLDVNLIKENGGIKKHLPKSPNIKLTEVDYSVLLSKTKELPTIKRTDNASIWKSLFKIAEESRNGHLPASQSEFLVDFLKDTKHSVAVLNQVYKKARSDLKESSDTQDVRSVILSICDYFNNHSESKFANEQKLNLMNVVTELHPDLISQLFEKTVIDGQRFDFAESITSNFSDRYVAEFMESLIGGTSAFNENLLKIFDKLSPGPETTNNLATLVAQRVIQDQNFDTENVSQIQMSIQELFKKQPKNDFMNELYQMTVDSVVNKKIDTLTYIARLSPQIHRFVQSMDDELRIERVQLLLNVLWHETDAYDFKKLSGKLLDEVPPLIESNKFEQVQDIFEFFLLHKPEEHEPYSKMAEAIQSAGTNLMSKEILLDIVEGISKTSDDGLLSIAEIFSHVKEAARGWLLDKYLHENNPVIRDKYTVIFNRLNTLLSPILFERINAKEPDNRKDLLQLLRQYDPVGYHELAKTLIQQKNTQDRWEALEGFSPKTKVEVETVFSILKKDKNREVKKKALASLLSTQHEKLVNQLFKEIQGQSDLLQHAVEVCGERQIAVSFSALKNIIEKKNRFHGKSANQLRIAAASNLVKVNELDGVAFLRNQLNDKNKHFADACRMIIQLHED